MKNNNSAKESSVTKPLLKGLLDLQKAEAEKTLQSVSIGSKPLSPPDLYQDSGGGYNPDFTFPQE
ncbi:MAG TPA: hypothetical protein VHZ55_03750 [Bryobacteraceae bacterium]|jgi:hypothetical protein|nr:hypothetical protein [Bryobacteraceae bacterium]